MCVAIQNRKNTKQTFILGVQGHSRSSMLTLLRSSSFVIISRMSMPICNSYHA